MGKGGQRVPTSSYKISQFGGIMYSMVTIVNKTLILYLQVAERVDIKSSHRKKK